MGATPEFLGSIVTELKTAINNLLTEQQQGNTNFIAELGNSVTELQALQTVVESTVDKIYIEPSDDVVYSDAYENYMAGGVTPVSNVLHSFITTGKGTVRIKLDSRAVVGTYETYIEIKVNGIVVSTTNRTELSYTSLTKDIAVEQDDLVEIVNRLGGSSANFKAYVKNFEVCYKKSTMVQGSAFVSNHI